MIEELGSSEEDPSCAADTPPAAVAAPLERDGDYRILREVGRGGMAVVYEAVQESLSRRVALKVLHLQAGHGARMLARFRRESRAAAQASRVRCGRRWHHANRRPK